MGNFTVRENSIELGIFNLIVEWSFIPAYLEMKPTIYYYGMGSHSFQEKWQYVMLNYREEKWLKIHSANVVFQSR